MRQPKERPNAHYPELRPTKPPIPEIPTTGDAQLLLEAVAAWYPFRSSTLAQVSEALRQEGLHPSYRFLPDVASFIELSEPHTGRRYVNQRREYSHDPKPGYHYNNYQTTVDSAVYVLIHPEQKGGQWVSLAGHWGEGSWLGYTHSFLRGLSEAVFQADCPAINFTLLYGSDNQAMLEKIRGVSAAGGSHGFDPIVAGRRLEPTPPRERDSAIFYHASIDVETTTNIYYPDFSPYNANWAQGWAVYGIEDIGVNFP